MHTYAIYSYSEVNHLSGSRCRLRYTARAQSPESAVGHSPVTGEPIGITVSRGAAELAYRLTGPIEIGRTADGDECVWPAGSQIGEPLDRVIDDAMLRAYLGVTLEPIDA